MPGSTSTEGLLGQMRKTANGVGSQLRGNTKGTSWASVSAYMAAANLIYGLLILLWTFIRLNGHTSFYFAALLGTC